MAIMSIACPACNCLQLCWHGLLSASVPPMHGFDPPISSHGNWKHEGLPAPFAKIMFMGEITWWFWKPGRNKHYFFASSMTFWTKCPHSCGHQGLPSALRSERKELHDKKKRRMTSCLTLYPKLVTIFIAFVEAMMTLFCIPSVAELYEIGHVNTYIPDHIARPAFLPTYQQKHSWGSTNVNIKPSKNKP